MNTSILTTFQKAGTRIALFFTVLLVSIAGFAQDTKAVDVNISSKGDGNFFSNPIVWIVGGAVFILLLVALLRSNNKNA